MKVIIGGALGRMGRELKQAAPAFGVDIVCGVDVAYQGQVMEYPIVRTYAEIAVDADALIDFSRADGLPDLLAYGIKASMPLVLCTTGYSEQEVATIEAAAKQIPIFRSANMSFGINVLQKLVDMATRVLGDHFDVEIIEKHHNQKLDSPSGTALMLYDTVNNARDGESTVVNGRSGRAAARTKAEVGVHAVRGGTVTGEHEVGFYGVAEEIILTHRAENRSLFAQGALRAAIFLAGKPAGLYAMQNMVNEAFDAQ